MYCCLLSPCTWLCGSHIFLQGQNQAQMSYGKFYNVSHLSNTDRGNSYIWWESRDKTFCQIMATPTLTTVSWDSDFALEATRQTAFHSCNILTTREKTKFWASVTLFQIWLFRCFQILHKYRKTPMNPPSTAAAKSEKWLFERCHCY
jgi:hypothetical protein